MAEKIKVSTDEMQATIARYNSARNTLQGAFKSLDSAINILNNTWKGGAWMAFKAMWDIANSNIRQSDERMRDAVDELNKTMEIMLAAEGKVKSNVSTLEAGSSPFN